MPEDRAALEEAIRSRCGAGDFEGAATRILEGYGREVLGFLISRVQNADTAGEIFSAFTLDLWRGLPAFEFRCSARVWAYTLARHAASHHIKAARRDLRRQVPLSEAKQLSAMEQKVRTETLAFHKTEVKQRIVALRETLPPDDQALLILRVNRKLDWTEIAHVLSFEGEPPTDDALKREAARLRKRFQLVKEKLRKMAQAEGLLEQG